jgi:TolC family type I secretion outer membrane protein
MGRSRGSTGCWCRRYSSVSVGLWLSLYFLAVTATNAQQTASPQTTNPNNQVPEVRTTPGAGSLPSSTFDPSSLIRQNLPGAARISAAPAQLSLSDAINLALQNNLSTLSAQEERQAATGFTQQARSALLPNISGVSYQANLTENLAALGFRPGTFPGFNTSFIGPFNNFDARAMLVQNIFDLSAIRNYQSSQKGVRIAEFRQRLAREQVAEATALTYLETLRSERNVSAAQANVTLAEALLKLAQDQRNAGVATGTDVTRAETRLAQERVDLFQAQTTAEQARLNLQRVIGVPLGSPLVLSDQLTFTAEALPQVDSAVSDALSHRAEVLISEAQVSMFELERKSVKDEYLPSLQFRGDYGVSGITPTDTALPTRRAAVQVNVPIFNGGLTQGRLTVATSRARQAELQLGSVRGQVEQDVRLAISTLRTSVERVRAAEDAVRLAERELEMSRDRFRAGVADNLEVINAQTSLANARAAQVQALAVYNAARLNLAAALGRAETFRW